MYVSVCMFSREKNPKLFEIAFNKETSDSYQQHLNLNFFY